MHTIDLVLPPTNGEKISSTRIRQALADGDIASANQWLGRHYRVSGEVIHGDARGRTIGFPTANLDIWAAQAVPSNGVYACLAQLGDQTYHAATNIGIRPTFGGDHVAVEAHLIDFDQEIYGETVTLSFVERLRGEQKF